MAFTQKSTTVEEPLIAIGISKQIQVYSLTVELEGSAENIVTIRDGLAGTILNKYVLVAQGDQKGFITDHVELVASNDITIECSSTELINIYTRSVNI